MSKIIRHCGVARNTGSRLFVVWRQVPDDSEHCLVIYQDSLPEAYVHAVSDLVHNQGQASQDLWDVMDKVGYLDGRQMLTVLHNNGYIRKLRTSDVDMHIGNGSKIPLSDLNASLDEVLSHKSGTVDSYSPFDKKETEFHEQGTIVERLLKEASQYEELAVQNRERAYAIDPASRPSVTEKTDSSTIHIELPSDISTTKAIEQVKKILQERKAAKNAK